MCKKKFLLFFMILFSGAILAQNAKFDTHAVTLKGELTKDDIFEKDFGRFDAYELNMQEGDLIYLSLKADFFPLMIVVAPSSQYKMAFPKDNKAEVNYKTEIDESGLWYIYIAGDSTDTGSHTLNLCYVSENARKLPKNSDFLTTVKFFLAHSVTDFNYFKDENCNTKDSSWNVNLAPNGVFESAKIIQKNGVSKIIVQIAIPQNEFGDYYKSLKNEYGKAWNIRKIDGKDEIDLSEIEGLRKITVVKNASGKGILVISTE